MGNEPGWHIELFTDQASVLVTDYGEQTLRFMASEPKPIEPGPGSVFTGRSGALDIRVELTPGPCQDTMIDREFETTVVVDVGGRVLRGCGDALY